MATSTDLRAAIDEVRQSLPEGQAGVEDLVQLEPASEGWAGSLERRLGAMPWWMISATVHAVLFLLMALLSVAAPVVRKDETVFSTDMPKKVEPEYDPTKKRDIFRNLKEIQAENKVENPVVAHESPESDHMETDNNMDNNTARGHEDAISDIPLGGTGVVGVMGVGGGGLAGCFGFRDGGGRKKAVGRFGGSEATESAVEAALQWLRRHQEADGHWDIKKYEGGHDVSGGQGNDEAVSALAMLAFLGAGYTHKAGKFQDNVSRVIEWLLKNQRPDGGWGLINQGNGYEIYASTIGTLAMAEAYGMTKDERLRDSAQKGVDYVLKKQDPYAGWHHGGLRSSSVCGWAVMALKSAKIAGLTVDGRGFQGATNWFDKVTDAKSGKVGYSGPGSYMFCKGYGMTAVGMVCRQFMGVPNNDPLLVKQSELLAAEPPKWEPKSSVGNSCQEPYYWYYGTLAMFQQGGEGWKKWNEALKPTLVNNQCKGPLPLSSEVTDKDGSWDSDMGWGPTGGRVYHTAINALSLEVYYRYLPMYSK